MSVTGLVPSCRLNNPYAFIFFPRSCFPNLSSFFLLSPWTPPSWLLTALCPKLDVKPFQTLKGVEELFHAFSLHTLKQCFTEELGWGWGTLAPCMTVWHLQSQVCNPFPSQMCCPAHGPGLGGFELGHFPTGLVTSSRVRTEAGRGSKEKLPTQQSTGSPGARGEKRRTWHRFSLLIWEPAVIFLPPYSTKPGQTITPTQSNTSSQTTFCRTTTESAPSCLMQQDISISLQHFYVCILGNFSGVFPRLFLLLTRATQNSNLAFQRACIPPSHFLSYVKLTTALSAPSIISIMKTVSITKARTDPWGISLTPLLQFNSKPWITTLTNAWWNAVHPHYRPAN